MKPWWKREVLQRPLNKIGMTSAKARSLVSNGKSALLLNGGRSVSFAVDVLRL
jgi:hypothetical protein